MIIEFGGLLLGLIAALLAFFALHLNRKLSAERLEFEKMKFQQEKDERERLAEWRKTEERRFLSTAADIAEHVSRCLMDEPTWAHNALRSANFLTYKDTVFETRLEHFREEKEELARTFLPYLIARCRRMIEVEHRDVYVLVDAGTTLYPFFELIGNATSGAWQARDTWIDSFHLATNNLPGLEKLMQTGLRLPKERYSELAIEDCQLLSGRPLPIFGALVGPETNAAILSLKRRALQQAEKDESEQPVFIALVVGNWVRIGTTTHCPIPMAKGGSDSHLGVKQTMVDNADEVYVVSPLGKLFTGATNDEVNRVLRSHSDQRSQSDQRYGDVVMPRPRTVKLVATSRGPGRVLREHSVALSEALLGTKDIRKVRADTFSDSTIEDLPHLVLQYDRFPDDKYLEFREEFPHEDTRTNQDLLKLFHVRDAETF